MILRMPATEAMNMLGKWKGDLFGRGCLIRWVVSRPTASLTPQSSFAHNRTTWLWSWNIPQLRQCRFSSRREKSQLCTQKISGQVLFYSRHLVWWLSIGILKIDGKNGLIVVTGGLISLLSLLSQDPNQDPKWKYLWSLVPSLRLLILLCRYLLYQIRVLLMQNHFTAWWIRSNDLMAWHWLTQGLKQSEID